MKSKLQVVFNLREDQHKYVLSLQVLRMAGVLALKDWLDVLKELGAEVDQGLLHEIEDFVQGGVVHRVISRGGLVLYKWPIAEGAKVVVELDEDELHERLYELYGTKSFTASKASKATSMERVTLEGLIGLLVKAGRLKEMGVRKFMGHPFQTYKVV